MTMIDQRACLIFMLWEHARANPSFSLLLLFTVLEKIVRLTPFKWDDIIVDGLRWLFKHIPVLGRFLKK